MEIKVSAIKFKADSKLEDFIKEKIEKLNTHYDSILGSDVMLKVDNTNTVENKIAEVKIMIKGNDLFAKKQCKTFEEAVDSATDALKKQILKHKAKLKKKP